MALRGPLADIHVVDASTTLGGAYCAKLFADGGAQVCLVEPAEGHPMRRWSAMGDVPDGRDGALFRHLRQFQRSVTVDATGTDALLADADVVITDGTSTLGDATDLARRHPGTVVVAITPFGLSGPWAGRPGTEFTAQAEGGALACRGVPELPPYQMGGRTLEWVGGVYAAAAALVAVRALRQCGQGDLIDLSLMELGNLTGTTYANLFHSLAGRPPIDPTIPSRTVELPSIEPTSDGWVGFNTNTREQLDAFLAMLGRDDLLASGEFGLLSQRVARAEEWNTLVADWTRQRTTAEVVAAASELRIPAAPVCSGADVAAIAPARERGVYLAADGGDGGSMRVPRRPWSIDDQQQTAVGAAPAVGAHNPRPFDTPRRGVPAASAYQPPMTGLRVLDLTAWWAGPSATHLLASMGAEVVHVESASRIDAMRTAGGLFFGRDGWWEMSAFFLQVNANKRDLTLALDTARGREVLLELVAHADVVVENYTPRVFDKFGLDWDTIRAANPNVIMMRMPAFGLSGTWRDRPGFAQTMEQVTGLAWLTGHREDQPRIQRGSCDPNGGLHAAFALLCALAQRDATGTGCFVEAPMVEAALAIAAEPELEWSAYGRVMERDGNRGPAACPQGIYATDAVEQWVAIACETDEQWLRLVEVLGDDRLRDPRYATAADRRRDHDEIDAVIAGWTRGRARDAAADTLAAAGVPAAAVRDVRTVHEHPQAVARGYFEWVDHPVAGRHLTPGMPYRSRHVDEWVHLPAPTLGQHNAEVLGGWLGYGDDELDELTREGVIGTRPPGV